MKRAILLCAALLALCPGCQTYHAKPLTDAAVDKALTPPDAGALRVDAASIQHPLLQPVQLDQAKGFTPDDLAVVAVLVNPSLRAERDRRQLAEAQLIQAKLLPNPQLSFGFDVPDGGILADTYLGYGIGLSWDIRRLFNPWPVRVAKKQLESVDLDVAYQEWQTAAGAKLAAYRLIALRAQVALAKASDDRLAKNLQLVSEASDKGLMTALDRSAAATASHEAHARWLEMRGEMRQQQLMLNRVLGMPADQHIRLRKGLTLPLHVDAPPADRLLDGLTHRRLDLLALQHGYQSQAASIRSAIVQQFPQVNLGFNHARDTGNVVTDGPAVTIDLPLFDRNQGQIAMERATRQQLFDEYTDRVFNARADVAKLLAEIHSLNRRIADAKAAEPSMQQLVDTYRQAVHHAQADVLSYYAAINSLDDQRITVLTLQQQLVESRIGLELATGLSRLDAAPPTPTKPADKPAGVAP